MLRWILGLWGPPRLDSGLGDWLLALPGLGSSLVGPRGLDFKLLGLDLEDPGLHYGLIVSPEPASGLSWVAL